MANRVTRSSNPAKHLGLPDAPRARRPAAEVKAEKAAKKKATDDAKHEQDQKNAVVAKLERNDAKEVAARRSARVKSSQNMESKPPAAGKKRTREVLDKSDTELQANEDVLMDDVGEELLQMVGSRDGSSPFPGAGDSELTIFESEGGAIPEHPAKKRKMPLHSDEVNDQPALKSGAKSSAEKAPPPARTLSTPQTPVAPKPKPIVKAKNKGKKSQAPREDTQAIASEPADVDVDMLENSDMKGGGGRKTQRAARGPKAKAAAAATGIGANDRKMATVDQWKTTGRTNVPVIEARGAAKPSDTVRHPFENAQSDSDSSSDSSSDSDSDSNPELSKGKRRSPSLQALSSPKSSGHIQDEDSDSEIDGIDHGGRNLFSSHKVDQNLSGGRDAQYSFSDDEEIVVKEEPEPEVIDIDYSDEENTVRRGHGQHGKPQSKPKRKAVAFVNVTEDEEAHEKSRKDGRSVKRHSTSVDGEKADAAVAPAQIAQPDIKKEAKPRVRPRAVTTQETDIDEGDNSLPAPTKGRQTKMSDDDLDDSNGPMPTPTRAKAPAKATRPPRIVQTSGGAPPKASKAASRVRVNENTPDSVPLPSKKGKETKRLAAVVKPDPSPLKKVKTERQGPSQSQNKSKKASSREKGVSQNNEQEIVDYDDFGYVDSGDEDVEEQAAATSPSKIGKRLTSALLVKVEDPKVVIVNKKNTSKSSSPKGESEHDTINVDCSRESTSAPNSKPGRVVYKNSDLPSGAHDQNRWRGAFIPTLLAYLGTLRDPWAVSDHKFLQLLQELWNAVYGRLVVHKVEIGDCVHYLASQRMYEWRGAIGLHAVRAFENFFKGSDAKGKYDQPKDRADFCRHILRRGRLFYESPLADNFEGLYLSNFVLGPLSHHIEVSNGAIEMPTLYSSRKDQYPFGALALSATAAYRAAKLYREQKVSWNAGQLVISKGQNAFTGKESKDTNFGYQQFGHITQQCLQSAMALSNKQLKYIYSKAEQELDTTPTASTQGPEEEFDFSKLVDKRKRA